MKKELNRYSVCFSVFLAKLFSSFVICMQLNFPFSDVMDALLFNHSFRNRKPFE